MSVGLGAIIELVFGVIVGVTFSYLCITAIYAAIGFIAVEVYIGRYQKGKVAPTINNFELIFLLTDNRIHLAPKSLCVAKGISGLLNRSCNVPVFDKMKNRTQTCLGVSGGLFNIFYDTNFTKCNFFAPFYSDI